MPNDRKAPPLTWQEDTDNEGPRFLCIGNLLAGQIFVVPKQLGRSWRAFIMTQENPSSEWGCVLGNYATAEKARAALYATVCKELGYE